MPIEKTFAQWYDYLGALSCCKRWNEVEKLVTPPASPIMPVGASLAAPSHVPLPIMVAPSTTYASVSLSVRPKTSGLRRDDREPEQFLGLAESQNNVQFKCGINPKEQNLIPPSRSYRVKSEIEEGDYPNPDLGNWLQRGDGWRYPHDSKSKSQRQDPLSGFGWVEADKQQNRSAIKNNPKAYDAGCRFFLVREEATFSSPKCKPSEKYRSNPVHYRLDQSSDDDTDVRDSHRPPGSTREIYKILSNFKVQKEVVSPSTFSGKDGTSFRKFPDDYEVYFEAKYEENERQQSLLLG